MLGESLIKVGQIEKGVGHVHPDFSEITEEQFEDYKSNPDGWDDTELLDNYVYRTWFQNWIMAPVFFAGTILGILIFFRIPNPPKLFYIF